VRSLAVTVSTPAGQLLPIVFQRQETVRVHALAAQLAVEGPDKGIVCRLARRREVQRQTPAFRPRIGGIQFASSTLIGQINLSMSLTTRLGSPVKSLILFVGTIHAWLWRFTQPLG
jgi:hypothetical protein